MVEPYVPELPLHAAGFDLPSPKPASLVSRGLQHAQKGADRAAGTFYLAVNTGWLDGSSQELFNLCPQFLCGRPDGCGKEASASRTGLNQSKEECRAHRKNAELCMYNETMVRITNHSAERSSFREPLK